MKAVLPGLIGTVAGFGLLISTAYAASMLTGKNGMTLYTFDNDKGGVSACYNDCAKKWPPDFATKGAKAMKGWTMVKRKDGKLQWAYDGKPLYYYAGDKKKGEMSGEGLGGVWHVVKG